MLRLSCLVQWVLVCAETNKGLNMCSECMLTNMCKNVEYVEKGMIGICRGLACTEPTVSRTLELAWLV